MTTRPVEHVTKESGGGTAWSRLLAPQVLPVLGLAALLVALGGAWVGSRPRPAGDRSAPLAVEGPALTLGEAVALPDGRVRFVWQPHPEADRYELRFYSTALGVIGRREAGPAPAVIVPAVQLPPSYRAGEPVLYRVAAFRAGEEIGISAAGTLLRP